MIFAAWWAVTTLLYGTCVMTSAWRFDAGAVAMVGLGATVLPIGLLVAIDATTRQLPRVISYGTACVALPMLMMQPRIESDSRWSAAYGAVLMLGIAWLARLASRGSLGLGDVHFSPLLGSVAGWFGASVVVNAWVIAAVAGSIVAAIVMIRGRGRRAKFAYGPLLVFGLCLAVITAGR